jgi:hypothetical protein
MHVIASDFKSKLRLKLTVSHGRSQCFGRTCCLEVLRTPIISLVAIIISDEGENLRHGFPDFSASEI